MKMLMTLGLVVALAAPAAAQSPGTLRASAAAALDAELARQYALPKRSHHMRNKLVFWLGVGGVVAGSMFVIASTTWAQKSDLSREDPNTRLNRDLAPCRTDPASTRLPLADCQVNHPLLWLGLGVTGAGLAGMVIGGSTDDVYIVPSSSARLTLAKVRF